MVVTISWMWKSSYRAPLDSYVSPAAALGVDVAVAVAAAPKSRAPVPVQTVTFGQTVQVQFISPREVEPAVQKRYCRA
jgi:hypothetical protein